ncbi:hypothetical protein [Morganella psychrotolerans]|uniref:Uncharacterized protein n=1 Tax=Morganella psychrotolerans TaxID=368603 RepID=A0A1B8HKU3_9GAMM|nr:hypothetical protein [Morganella psychrotolerans]OBU09931.1 hypothetical protein AYY17_17055 [Morganella psychrotolerans]
MGRFADINIKNNTDNINVVQSNSGGYNIQNTQVINKTINNNHKKSTDSDGNPIVVGSAVAVIFIVSLLAWLFF